MNELIIIGTGGHATVVIEAAVASGREVLGLIDTDYQGQKESISGIKVLGGFEVLLNYDRTKVSVIIAIGDNFRRKKYFLQLKHQGYSFAIVTHPTAVISESATIGEGVFINACAIISAEVIIKKNCIINSGVIVEHEVKVGGHCHLAPGVKVGGRTLIEENVFVGIGSNIIDYLKIGKNVIIGAGSIIVKNVSENLTVVGLGKIIK